MPAQAPTNPGDSGFKSWMYIIVIVLGLLFGAIFIIDGASVGEVLIAVAIVLVYFAVTRTKERRSRH